MTTRTGDRRTAHHLLLARDGVSAVEFAMLLPVLIALMGGSFELSGAITAANRASYVAETIGQTVSQVSATISVDDMSGYIRMASLIDPDIIDYAQSTGKSLDTAVNVAVSSVAMTPQVATCTTNCTYNGDVVFSRALSGPTRACTRLAVGSGSGSGTLPAGAFGPNSLIVVDVEAFYRPLMTTLFGTEISFKRSAYFTVRNLDHANYAANCPGYPSS